MRANTIIMVSLAVIFGVIAVVLANMWLAGQRMAIAAPRPDAPRDMIVVAAVPLKFGETLTAEKLREIPWPVGARPTGAFRSAIELLDSKEGERQALQAIGANEPILASKITGPGQRATLSAVLAEGMRAVSIRVNDVLGVAGFVFPGDRVDVLLTRDVRDADGNQQSYVDVLLQSVKVLAVDQVADESTENPTVVKAVTVEVGTEDAQKLTLAAGNGVLSLALRQSAEGKDQMTRRVTLSDLSGEDPAAAARRKAEAEKQAAIEAERKRAEAQLAGMRSEMALMGKQFEDKLKALQAKPEIVVPEKPTLASVGVFRGLERQVYEVPHAK
jgi:pilus assembly protein CpaB